jgi:hypothetical protein
LSPQLKPCYNVAISTGGVVRSYIAVCGLIFALVAVAHGVELANGGLWHLREADFLASSAATLGMLGWSIYLFLRR